MAKAGSTIVLKVDANTAKAIRSFANVGNKGSKSLSKIEKSAKQATTALKAVGAAVAGAIVLKGIQSLTSSIGGFIEAARVQEDAINRVNNALKLSGDFSKEASQDFQNFASSLQGVSTQGDETTLELLALAKTFGVTNEGAKQLTLAATELATATGQSAETALRNLGKTLTGTTGRLAESVPAVKELTKEQLASGEAVRLVLNRFGGAATGELATFSGAYTQLTNTIGDFKEEIGQTVIESEPLINVFKGLERVFSELISSLDSADIDIGSVLADGIKFAFNAIVSFSKITVEGFTEITKAATFVARGFLLIAEEAAKLKFVQEAVRLTAASLSQLLEVVGAAASLFSEELAVKVAQAQFALDDFGSSDLRGLDESVRESIKNLDSFEKKIVNGADSFTTLADKLKEVFEAPQKGIEKTSKDLVDLEAQIKKLSTVGPSVALPQPTGSLTADPFALPAQGPLLPGQNAQADLSEAFKSGFNLPKAGPEKPLEVEIKEGPSLTSSLTEGFGQVASVISSGAQSIVDPEAAAQAAGASTQAEIDRLTAALDSNSLSLAESQKVQFELAKLRTQQAADEDAARKEAVEANRKAGLESAKAVGTSVLDNVLPGLGQIFNLFTQDPEAAKGFIDSFLQAIPVLIETVADNFGPILTALIDGIISALPSIVDALILAIPKIAFALVDSLITKGGIFRLAGALIQGMIQLAAGLVRLLVQGIATGLNAFIQGFVTNLVQGGAQFLQGLFSSLVQTLRSVLFDIPVLIVRGIVNGFKQAVTNLVNRLREVFDEINPTTGSGGFIGKVSREGISALNPFRQGGIVKANDGLFVPGNGNTDSVPALLTPGELVIPRNATQNFAQVVGEVARNAVGAGSNEGESKMISVQLILNEEILAEQILNLNQNNARLA